MATINIVNATDNDIRIDGYIKAYANTTTSREVNPSDIPKMVMLAAAVAEETLSYNVVYTADEIASGLITQPDSVQVADLQPVTLTDAASDVSLANGCFIIQRTLATGGATGTADDVVIFAAGSLPTTLGPKLRIVDAWAFISTAGDTGTSMVVRTAAAGAGSALVSISTNATGRFGINTATTSSPTVTINTSNALIVRRSDRSAVGKIFLLCTRETA